MQAIACLLVAASIGPPRPDAEERRLNRGGVEPGWSVVRIGARKVSDWLDRGPLDLAAVPARDGLPAAPADRK